MPPAMEATESLSPPTLAVTRTAVSADSVAVALSRETGGVSICSRRVGVANQLIVCHAATVSKAAAVAAIAGLDSVAGAAPQRIDVWRPR